MFSSLVFAAATAGLVAYADARFATQGSSNVAVYWGELVLVTLVPVCRRLKISTGQSSGGMEQKNLSTYCAGESLRFAMSDQQSLLTSPS